MSAIMVPGSAFVKQLHFDYDMQIDYSEMVSSCHYTIKCFPFDTKRQKVGELSIVLSPDAKYSVGEDSFCNRQIYGSMQIPHRCFRFHIDADVVTGLSDFEEPAKENCIAVYRYPHGSSTAGEALRAYHAQIEPGEALNPYEKSIFLMHRLYQDFSYDKNKTDMNTTAEEAWRLGGGVCQDYTHILITLLHMEHIPARYVTGMLVGEGASHAWVEMLHEGKWYGIDPTNDKTVGDEHIRIGSGRDAFDCLINRGVMRGGGKQTQQIRVSVTEKQRGIE